MIIDFHTHIFPPWLINERETYIKREPLFCELYSSPKAKLITADELIDSMNEQEVDVSIALNMSWKSPELCQRTNDYIIESISRFPDRLVGFGMLDFDSPGAALKELERCVNNGIKGFGEIRPEGKAFTNFTALKPLIKAIIDHNLILLTHSSEPVGHDYPGKGNITPEVLYPFIAAFPGLKMVCSHWGGGLPFYALMPEVLKTLENVYFDTAASPFLYNSQIYNRTLELLGDEKILFGSDYPLLKPQRLIKEIYDLHLGDDAKNKILANNAKRILGMK